MNDGTSTIKLQTYASHLNTVLLPSLDQLRRNLAKLEQDIAEYDDVSQKAKLLVADARRPQEAMMDLGAGVYVDVIVPDTSQMTLDLGLDIHLQMPVDEAGEYAAKRVTMLQKRRSALKIKEENLIWQIEQFRGAMNQASGLAT
ncbi:Prefoldin subunit-domain-containing protein [Kockovaella imperatae]|uniref:Prefoldin subunit-domain-containing protein n=1 Tax=Kockovaella imperatae TaxID=4999 RepID=A0A1Y1UJM0_9TREE|nr:Prefoldin subunit-domain-containing protein [Kockovaella imperatae]ORX38248.1 Prefoldin subunit-domain-containing protein [Kockovaella imperatae]